MTSRLAGGANELTPAPFVIIEKGTVVSASLIQEVATTLHLHSTELPYIDLGFGMSFRILHARPKESLFVTQILAEPFTESHTHRHHIGNFGFTLRGQWGHDKRYLYGPGTYVFETPGVVHQFFNGPEVSEILFSGNPSLEFIDVESGEVTGRNNSDTMLERYHELCREAGVRPAYLE